MSKAHQILAFATKGTGTNEEHRLRGLLKDLPAEFLPFDKSNKRASGRAVFSTLLKRRPDLVVMEGTGLAGGLPCLAAKLFAGVPFVVSSGDAVAPFIGAIHPLLRPFFAIYERLLCRYSAGFIGWTPYLVGRALTLGAPRGMTAAGWGPPHDPARHDAARRRIRNQFNIGDQTILFGLVGALVWNRRLAYSYGTELIRAITQLPISQRVAVMVVGDGTGLDHLRNMAGDRLGRDIFLPGPVPAEQVADYLAAFDVGSLPQSVDGVGSFRYTTKLSEYLSARLPVVTGAIPASYDLNQGWLWRLGGSSPWSEKYIHQLADLMTRLTHEQIALKQQAIPSQSPDFDQERQVHRATEFLCDILAERAPKPAVAQVPSPETPAPEASTVSA